MGAVCLAGLAVLVLIWVGLAGLSLSGEPHCRDTRSGDLIEGLTGPSGVVALVDGGGDRCELPGADGTGAWASGGGDAVDITGGEASGADWLLPDRYEWREAYALSESLAGRFTPVLAPVWGLLALMAVVGLVIREWE